MFYNFYFWVISDDNPSVTQGFPQNVKLRVNASLTAEMESSMYILNVYSKTAQFFANNCLWRTMEVIGMYNRQPQFFKIHKTSNGLLGLHTKYSRKNVVCMETIYHLWYVWSFCCTFKNNSSRLYIPMTNGLFYHELALLCPAYRTSNGVVKVSRSYLLSNGIGLMSSSNFVLGRLPFKNRPYMQEKYFKNSTFKGIGGGWFYIFGKNVLMM